MLARKLEMAVGLLLKLLGYSFSYLLFGANVFLMVFELLSLKVNCSMNVNV